MMCLIGQVVHSHKTKLPYFLKNNLRPLISPAATGTTTIVAISGMIMKM